VRPLKIHPVISPEALSEAKSGSNLFASAREPMVTAPGFFISGSREQERRMSVIAKIQKMQKY
jgi:hypothetical protein